MKKIKSDLYKLIRKAMIDNDINMQELSQELGMYSGSNLSKSIIENTIGGVTLIKLCIRLNLDIKEVYKLKNQNESSKQD